MPFSTLSIPSIPFIAMFNLHLYVGQLSRAAVCASSMMSLSELVIYLPEEVEYIWMSIRDFSILKACYIFARYAIFYMHYLHFMRGDIPEFLDPTLPSHREIERWLFRKNCFFQALLWTIDYPTMKRVYLLNGRSRWAYRLLFILGILKLGSDFNFGWRVHEDRLQAVYSTSKVPDHLLPFFAVPELLLHATLLALAIHGEHGSKTRYRTPVTTRLKANGLEAVIMGMFCIIPVGMYAYVRDLTPVIYPLITAGISASACRLILSLHRSFYRKPRMRFDALSSDSSNEDDNEDR